MDTKICTSLEQSKKLMELGIDVNTADMYWLNRFIDLTQTKYVLFVVDRSEKHIDFFNSYAVAVEKGEIIPAWSLTALFGVLPKIGAHEPMLRKLYYISEPTERYICQYSLTDMTSEYDNPVDACYEMIIKLKEKNLL